MDGGYYAICPPLKQTPLRLAALCAFRVPNRATNTTHRFVVSLVIGRTSATFTLDVGHAVRIWAAMRWGVPSEEHWPMNEQPVAEPKLHFVCGINEHYPYSNYLGQF